LNMSAMEPEEMSLFTKMLCVDPEPSDYS